MPNLFLDSDGVFYDFDAHVLALFGQTSRQLGDDRLWALATAHPDFWTKMPIKPGAQKLWDAVKHVNPMVLTGCPKSDYETAAAHKVVRWREDFDHSRVTTCLSRDKALHMEQPGDILVDDFVKNLKRWEKAGGIGILYKGDPDPVIEKLKALGAI